MFDRKECPHISEMEQENKTNRINKVERIAAKFGETVQKEWF